MKIISIIILITFLSCSKKTDLTSTPVSFKTAVIAGQTGGVIISGVSTDNQMFFKINPDNNWCPGWKEVFEIKICNMESQPIDLSYRICDDEGCASLKVYETVPAHSCIDTEERGGICKHNLYVTDIDSNKLEICN